MMATKSTKTAPTWGDVKKRLLAMDQAGVIGLLQDLYAASPENKAFLHTRFSPGENVLAPYKKTIERWLYPDVRKNQDISVAKAKKAITDYKKAIGQAECMAELMVYFCECAARFCAEFGMTDEGFSDALVRMFDAALKTIVALPAQLQGGFVARLVSVRRICDDFGYGVGDSMGDLFMDYEIKE